MTDREREARIRERLEAIDYPEWAWEPFGEKSNNFIVGPAYDGDDRLISGRMPEPEDAPDAIRIEVVCEKHDAVGYANAELISHAPSDLRFLLARVERYREALEDCVKAIESLPQDALGREPKDGYYYRDEVLDRARRSLNDGEDDGEGY